jgi:hypothetical protein
MPYMKDMPRTQKISFALQGVFTTPTVTKARQQRRAHAREILEQVDAAKTRKTGIDVTDISDAELLADLRRRQVRA